jgi:hypothetical protein
MTEPKDYYGEALAVAIRRQIPNPETTAAIMAQIAEAMEDTLALLDEDRGIEASVEKLLKRSYPRRGP